MEDLSRIFKNPQKYAIIADSMVISPGSVTGQEEIPEETSEEIPEEISEEDSGANQGHLGDR